MFSIIITNACRINDCISMIKFLLKPRKLEIQYNHGPKFTTSLQWLLHFYPFGINISYKYTCEYYQETWLQQPLWLRKLNTCFKFPRKGRAFTANLQINISLCRISNFVMTVSLKDFPSSKHPEYVTTIGQDKKRRAIFHVFFNCIM